MSTQQTWQVTVPQKTPSTKSNRGGKIAAGVVGGVAVLAAGLYGVGYAVAGDKMPKNATIASIAVGGLTPSQAQTKLETEYAAIATKPIEVALDSEQKKTLSVDPAEAGLMVDYPATIAQAGGGRSFHPAAIWRVLTGGSKTEPVVTVDQAKLAAAVADLAGQLDSKPIDATVTYAKGKVAKTPGSSGIVVEQDEAAQAIRAAYLGETQTAVFLPAEVTEPAITGAEADEFVKNVATATVSGPVTVKVGDAGSLAVSPAMLTEALTVTTTDGALGQALDPARLLKGAESEVKKLTLKKPKNATVKLVDGKPTVIDAVRGTGVAAADLAKAVEAVLTRPAAERTVSVAPSGQDAKFGTEDAKKLGIKQVIGEFTTQFPYAPYRNTNIGRAAQLINGTVLKPGETFSLNKIVGERTYANGFVDGNIISGGQFKLEPGGGVSQSATTTYNAMFFAGLEDIEHKPHSLFIDRYPAGREATVAWPTVDLRFKNNTKYGVLVQANVKKGSPGVPGSITVKMWSTKTWDKVTSSKLRRSNFTSGRDVTATGPKCQPMSPVAGFDVNYERLFHKDGKVAKREKFHWRYNPTDHVTCD